MTDQSIYKTNKLPLKNTITFYGMIKINQTDQMVILSFSFMFSENTFQSLHNI